MRPQAFTIVALALFWPLALAAGPALAAEPACEVEVSDTALTEAVARAEAHYRALEIEAFKGESDEIRASIPCLAAPITPQTAAAVHRVLGIRAFGERDVEAATRSFAAARLADSSYSFSENLIPQAHPVRDAYVAIDVSGLSTEDVPTPSSGDLYFDGRPGDERTLGVPAIVQLVEGQTASLSALVVAGEPLPDFSVSKQPGPSDIADAPRAETSPLRVPLLATAGTAAVATGVLYGIGAQARSKFYNDADTYEELETQRSRANAMGWAATATGVVAVGAGVGVVLTSRW